VNRASSCAWRASAGKQSIRLPAKGCVLPRKQAGVALLTALLVVSLATTAAAALLSRQQIDLARTENLLNSEQAYQYALGVEIWAAGLLAADRKTTATDHLQEPWASKLDPVMVEGGEVSGYTEDMQGRLNLNNLAQPGEAGAIAKQRFERLLGVVGGAPSVADALADWLDTDSEMRDPNGAEDEAYLSEQPPYRAANGKLVSESELRLVKGVTKELYRAVAPYVTALPVATSVNVNTASIPVLMCLVRGLSEGEAKSLVGARGKTGFASVDAFLGEVSFLGRRGIALGLGVTSEYFQTRAEVNVARARVHLTSLLHRSPSGFTEVIRRSEAGG
jgi:general secretion pathway protein K